MSHTYTVHFRSTRTIITEEEKNLLGRALQALYLTGGNEEHALLILSANISAPAPTPVPSPSPAQLDATLNAALAFYQKDPNTYIEYNYNKL